MQYVLPPWLQMVLSVLVFVVGATVYLRGLFKALPTHVTQGSSKDVIVPALSIADNAVIAQATDTLRESNRVIREARTFDQEMIFLLRQMVNHLEDAKHALERIERRQDHP